MKSDDVATQQGNISKIDRYKWIIRDVPGELKWIQKNVLEVDHTYQRGLSNMQVTELASKWSWTACGVIVVGKRPNGEFVVIDGQHRVGAALKRTDISELPCIVFTMDSVSEEAKNFVIIDTNRRNLNSIDKFKADIIAKDPTALLLVSILEKYGIKIAKNKAPKSINSVVACRKLLEQDKVRFENTIELLSIVCEQAPINEMLLRGLYYLSKNLTVDITDPKLRQRIAKITSTELTRGAIKSTAYFGSGGAKVYAMGILEVINKHLPTKYKFKEEVATD